MVGTREKTEALCDAKPSHDVALLTVDRAVSLLEAGKMMPSKAQLS